MKTILLCDDSLMIRTQLRDYITTLGMGYNIIEAADGASAIQLFADQRPDLVILDIVIPGQDGLAALARMKQTNPEVPVVILSSAGTKATLREALNLGASDFLQKPWSQKLISDIINRYLGG